MSEKNLQKLRRSELLELMLALSEENEALLEQVEAQSEQLQNRAIQVGEAGSIAAASLAINEVFEIAQQAADQYLENIRRLENEAQMKADGLFEETRRKCIALETAVQEDVVERKAALKEFTRHYLEAHEMTEEQLRSIYAEFDEADEAKRG